MLKGPQHVPEEEHYGAESQEESVADGGAVDASREVLGQLNEDPVENLQVH